MLKHYLKVAFRNMWKYKMQSGISIVGLAMGFICFALAMLWIRYEMSYDKFHRNAERIYCVYKPAIFTHSGMSRSINFRTAALLKETFPEISDASTVTPEWYITGSPIKIDEVEHPAFRIKIDSAFFRMFDIRILEGNRDFLIPLSNKVAITQQKAREWFGNETPIGKELIYYGDKKTICAVVAGWNQPSNYRFDIIESLEMNYTWNDSRGENVLIKLLPETNIEAFKKKLAEFKTEKKSDNNTGNLTIEKIKLIPLTQIRYKDTDINREVSFQYIVYFAIAGLLVIFCSLLNYLILFISRFRIRQKELALRVVCGASGSSLFLLLSVEFLLTLLLAFGLGLTCVQLVLPTFRKLAEIHSDTITVYGQLSGYVLGVILLSFLIFLLILIVFRKRTLNVSIRRGRSNLFRYASIVLQLIISIGFIFCTSVLLKQIYYLHHTSDIGFSYKNIANVGVYPGDMEVLANQLKKIPEITDILLLPKGADAPLFPVGGRTATYIFEWDDKPSKKEPVVLSLRHHFSGHIIEFYGIQLLKGEWLDENDSINVLINEAAVKAFGWDEPIGKSFGMDDNNRVGYKVKGVIKNIYNLLPTMPPSPWCYSQKGYTNHGAGGGGIPIKYQEGTWKIVKSKIENLFEKEYKNAVFKDITQAEEAYDDLFKSEAALLKLLSFVSLICIVICLFGFVSIVSLTCEERRKEIAIRKINGATVHDILIIFFREFTALLALGALVAFTFGYYIMKKWLEQYNLQTAIPLWLYVAILLALASIIILCVGWRVYKTSNENPAEVVKRE